MSDPDPSGRSSGSDHPIDVAIKIALAALLIYWCFYILRPFVPVLLWALILGIATYPLSERLGATLGRRQALAAGLLTATGLLLTIGPLTSLGIILADDANLLLEEMRQGEIRIPPPHEGVRNWPIVGQRVYDFWAAADRNLGSALQTIQPELQRVARTVLSSAASVGVALLQFLVAVVIAGVLIARMGGSKGTWVKVANRVVGDRGEKLLDLVTETVRNVSKGILGTAAIQSFLAAIGLIVAGIPAAGLLSFACFVLAIIQLGPGLILIPAIIYMFAEQSTLAAVFFTAWSVPVMFVDNVLKPILMGKGASVPIIVIFLGVIGGTLAYGLIGIFVGPVVLAVGYRVFVRWVDGDEQSSPA